MKFSKGILIKFESNFFFAAFSNLSSHKRSPNQIPTLEVITSPNNVDLCAEPPNPKGCLDVPSQRDHLIWPRERVSSLFQAAVGLFSVNFRDPTFSDWGPFDFNHGQTQRHRGIAHIRSFQPIATTTVECHSIGRNRQALRVERKLPERP